MQLWAGMMDKATSMGVKVAVLEGVWWGRLLKTFGAGGFSNGKGIWIERHLFGNIVGAQTLGHELHHIEQYGKHKWHFWVEYLWPWSRIWWEVQAYKEDMRWDAQFNEGRVPQRTKEWICRSLCGKLYWFYGRLTPTMKWIEQAAKEVEAE